MDHQAVSQFFNSGGQLDNDKSNATDCIAGEKERKLPSASLLAKGSLEVWLCGQPAPGRRKEMSFYGTREAKEPWLIKEKRRGKNLPPPPPLSVHRAKPPSPHSPHSPSLPHSASFLRYQRRSSSLQREGKLQGPKLHISQSTCHKASTKSPRVTLGKEKKRLRGLQSVHSLGNCIVVHTHLESFA